MSVPTEAKAGKAKLIISAQKDSKSSVKILPCEIDIKIIDKKNDKGVIEWAQKGWKPDNSPEENTRILDEYERKENERLTFGVDEVKFRVYENPLNKSGKGTIAIMATIKKGYYIYGNKKGNGYKNTSFNWKLPRGFKIDRINWPEPKMKQIGNNKLPIFDGFISLSIEYSGPKNKKPGKKYKLNLHAEFEYSNGKVSKTIKARQTINVVTE